MRTWFVVLVLLTHACGVNNPDVEHHMLGVPGPNPGIIKFYDARILISVPETARTGESVTVTVRTYGDGCFSEGETRVTIDGRSVVVEPFDNVREGACEDILLGFQHEATITFHQIGLTNVEIVGRSWPENQPFSRRYNIDVQ